MKTINYTGSSKLISRIVNLLNRKAPLPLNGGGDPDWGTNGQVLSTDGNGNTAWVNQGGGGSGGHTIESTDGTDLPQEDNLQFVGVYTEDDSANDRTKVNIVRQMTKAAMQALSSAEKEGFIDTTDEDDDYIPISAEDVKYGNTDVESALDSINATLASGGRTVTAILNESVSIPSGTIKSYAALTKTTLLQYDELHLYLGGLYGTITITKGQLNALPFSEFLAVFGINGASGGVRIDSTGTTISAQGSAIDKILFEGIKYNY